MHIYFCHCWKMISCLSLLSLIKIFRFLLSRIAECFAFLVCTKWFNPMIHREVHNREPGSSSNAIRYREWSSGLVLPSFEDQHQEQLCGLPDIGGHIMKVPLVIFQVLLCMHLEVIFLSQVWAFGQIFSLPIVYLFGQLCDFLHVIVNDLNLFFKTCCKVIYSLKLENISYMSFCGGGLSLPEGSRLDPVNKGWNYMTVVKWRKPLDNSRMPSRW